MVAVPETVITLVVELNEAVIPGGKFVGVPIAVTPVVIWVKFKAEGLLIQTLGYAIDVGPTVAKGVTVKVPVAFTAPHPPVKGME